MTERTLPEENTAETSATFDLLANARRRGVLYALERDGAATVEELASRIAAWQGEGDEPLPENVHASLVHSHLPKLHDANVVEYDREDGSVELADCGDLDRFLRAASKSEPSFSNAGRRTGFAD